MKRQWITPLVMGVAAAAVLALVSDHRPASAEGDFAYVSQRGCKKCHFKTHRSWKDTVHAKALDILKPGERADVKTQHELDPQKDYTKDPVCVGCHTTGYGKPGGYPEIKDTWTDEEQKAAKDNAGVGCEACHGPGEKYAEYKADHEDYKRDEIAKLGLNAPLTAEACTKCHQAEGNPTVGDSYTFNFEEMKAKAEAIHEHVELKHPH